MTGLTNVLEQGGIAMAIVFITGSMDGLGRAAPLSLLQASHQVVLHARSEIARRPWRARLASLRYRVR
jgi:NAD(P)-dependent dehydrogenase (short-subunit alcohol dehydrogenase family)